MAYSNQSAQHSSAFDKLFSHFFSRFFPSKDISSYSKQLKKKLMKKSLSICYVEIAWQRDGKVAWLDSVQNSHIVQNNTNVKMKKMRLVIQIVYTSYVTPKSYFRRLSEFNQHLFLKNNIHHCKRPFGLISFNTK